MSLTERTSRANSENTYWVQASVLYKAWVILGRDGKSFFKELSFNAIKKKKKKKKIPNSEYGYCGVHFRPFTMIDAI